VDSDEQIIEKFQRSGDPSDWEPLVDRHFNAVHGLAFKMTCNRSIADDITQDVFLKVTGALGKFKGDSLFSTWLYRIAMNTIYTRLRKEKHIVGKTSSSDANVSLKLQQSDQQRVSVDNLTPERLVLQKEMLAEIDRGIQNLKPEFRAAIVLTAFQGLTPGEAAEVENCTPQTMYWRLNQVRNQLKKELKRYLQS